MLSNSDNAGLAMIVDQLDNMWRGPACTRISRADFWYLGAKALVEIATPYVMGPAFPQPPPGGPATFPLPNFHIPFFTGREDVATCDYAESRLPSANKNASEIKRVLIDSLGMTPREAVSLMGGHTVGFLIANNSGFQGSWKGRADVFSTGYFKTLLGGIFQKTPRQDPRTSAVIHQWNPSNIGPGLAFITPDIGMIYDMNDTVLPDSCGPLGAPQNLCPRLGAGHPELSQFEQIIQDFAEGTQQTNDMPGAGKFLSVFARAFHKMASVGYAQGDLTCLQCASPNCPTCTQAEMCAGPQYGFFPPAPGAPPPKAGPLSPSAAGSAPSLSAPTAPAPLGVGAPKGTPSSALAPSGSGIASLASSVSISSSAIVVVLGAALSALFLL